MKKQTIHIKIDQTKLRDEAHFDVQRTTRAHVFKPKKGKGSFTRKQKHKNRGF